MLPFSHGRPSFSVYAGMNGLGTDVTPAPSHYLSWDFVSRHVLSHMILDIVATAVAAVFEVPCVSLSREVVFWRSNRLHHGGDTNSSTTADHLDAGLPTRALEVVGHLPEEDGPGRANGMAQRNGATRRIHPGI